MKKTVRKILSFVVMVCVAFMGVFTTMPMVSAKAAEAGNWTLVTDASTLAVGDKVVIAANEYDYALSTTQNNNNRGQEAITKSSDNSTIEIKDTVQILTLEKGNVDGTFAFYTGSGYLYAASSSSNNLKTQTTLTDNSYWSITIENGVASVVAQGTNTRNVMKYNPTSSLFSCYAASNTQKDICLYKLSEDTGSTEPSTPTPSVTISGYDKNYMQIGDTVNLTATPENTTSTTVAWSSSNESVATVNENGNVTGVAMGTATITASVGTEAKATKEINVYPVENSTLSIAEAIAVCKLTGTTNSPYVYSATGIVTSIDTAYNSEYGNITVTITDTTGSIKAFRMTGGSDLEVNKTIKVTGTLINFEGNTPEFVAGCTYEIVENSDINAVQAYMSLAYKYTQKTVERPILDEEEVATFNFGENGTATHSDGSEITTDYIEADEDYELTLAATKVAKVYKNARDGQGNSCIKLGTSSVVGSFSFTVPEDITKVVIAVAGYKVNTVTVSVNGTDYAISTCSNDGNYTSIEVDTSSDKTVEFATTSTGYRAMINSIIWEKGVPTGETKTVVELSDSEFRIRCGVDATLAEIENVTEYGITIIADGKTAFYKTGAESWTEDTENNMLYVVISLGDIINDLTKLGTEFTVTAYIVVDGLTYVSANAKTHSVADMVEKYYTEKNITEVEHLYNYLFGEVA